MYTEKTIPTPPLDLLRKTHRFWFSTGHRNKIIRVGVGLDGLEKSLLTQPALLLYDKTCKFTHTKTMATAQDAKADNFGNQKKISIVLIFQCKNWEPETLTPKVHIKSPYKVQRPKLFVVGYPRV